MLSTNGSARLTTLPGTLRAKGFVVPDYRVLREKAINGAFPAHQVNGIWHFCEADASRIADALNLRRSGNQRAA